MSYTEYDNNIRSMLSPPRLKLLIHIRGQSDNKRRSRRISINLCLFEIFFRGGEEFGARSQLSTHSPHKNWCDTGSESISWPVQDSRVSEIVNIKIIIIYDYTSISDIHIQ